MLPIVGILSSEQVAEIRRRLVSINYEPGSLTASANYVNVKDNEQAAGTETQDLQRMVREALTANYQFRIYAMPHRWANMAFAHYGNNGHYGRHVDHWSQAQPDGTALRRDLSFTLFLSEPSSYEGGELVLERLDGPLSVKLPAGSVFIYPTGYVHQVTPVTSGSRHVCIGWIQSLVRDEEQRNLLYELNLVFANTRNKELDLILNKSISTLLRMWSDT
jgi:PKHD-type hydroxylase